MNDGWRLLSSATRGCTAHGARRPADLITTPATTTTRPHRYRDPLPFRQLPPPEMYHRQHLPPVIVRVCGYVRYWGRCAGRGKCPTVTSTDRSISAAGAKPPAVHRCCRSTGQTDGQTDTVPLHRRSSLEVDSVSKNTGATVRWRCAASWTPAMYRENLALRPHSRKICDDNITSKSVFSLVNSAVNMALPVFVA